MGRSLVVRSHFAPGFPQTHNLCQTETALWLDTSTWNDTTKAGVKQFAFATMDVTQDWFFWTWKVRRFLPSFIFY
jgi:hypothetical protein